MSKNLKVSATLESNLIVSWKWSKGGESLGRKQLMFHECKLGYGTDLKKDNKLRMKGNTKFSQSFFFSIFLNFFKFFWMFSKFFHFSWIFFDCCWIFFSNIFLIFSSFLNQQSLVRNSRWAIWRHENKWKIRFIFVECLKWNYMN